MVPNAQFQLRSYLCNPYKDENNRHCQQYNDIDRDAGRTDAREHTSDWPGNQSEERQCKGYREHVEDETYH
jgi:hypothetical protein